MGAARVRRAAAGTTVDHINSETGSVYAFKQAGISYTGYMRLMQEMQKDPTRPARVPCRSCTACCYHSRIEVVRANEPAERLAHLDLVPDPLGDMQMRKREDGACVHLGERGCSVYEHRPTTCRIYDCRTAGLFSMAVDHGNGHIEPGWEFIVANEDDKVLKNSILFLKDRYRADTGDYSGDLQAEANYIGAKLNDTMVFMRRGLKEHTRAAA